MVARVIFSVFNMCISSYWLFPTLDRKVFLSNDILLPRLRYTEEEGPCTVSLRSKNLRFSHLGKTASRLRFLQRTFLKVPKCEIFDRSDFHDFYPIKSLWEGDFAVKIKRF